MANKKSDASDVSRFEYALDGAGVRRTMAISGSAYTSASVGYDYDGAYQLTKETRTGGSAYTQSFLYDNSGNRTKSNLGGADTVYYYDYIDRMTRASDKTSVRCVGLQKRMAARKGDRGIATESYVEEP